MNCETICTQKSNTCPLIRCYDENEDLFAEALAKDLRKPRQEAVMFEVKISNHRFKELCLG